MTLPNFLLIGAAKAGTSALYNYLWQHPQIYMSGNKEPNFFMLGGQPAHFAGPSDDVVNLRSIHRQNEYETLFAEVGAEKMIGEASTPYLRSEIAAERIAQLIPHAKLIAMLRNPVERTFSCFQHARRDEREPNPTLLEAIAAEPERIANNWENLWYYTTASFYAKQLQTYYNHFPAEQIGVYIYEHFVAEPQAVMDNIFGFLGVDPFEPDMSVRYNVSGKARSRWLQTFLVRPHGAKELLKPFIPSYVRQRLMAKAMSINVDAAKQTLTAEERTYLQGLYRDDTLQLQEMLGIDLSIWLEEDGTRRAD